MPRACLYLGFLVATCGCGQHPTKLTTSERVEQRYPLIADSRPTTVTDGERAGHQQMVDQLSALKTVAETDNQYYGDGTVSTFRELAISGRLTSSPTKRLQFDFQHGMHELRLGNEETAIDKLESGYRRAKKLYADKTISKNTYLNAVFRLGLAYMRFGETQNCCLQHNMDSCLLPIRGGGIHTEQEGSRRAMQFFQEQLNATDLAHDDSKLYYEAVWLLNIAAMTLGEHPSAVPELYRIPTNSYRDEANFPRFPNIATQLGVDQFSMSGGAIAQDFDGDDRIDLLVGSWDLREHIRLYRNVGRHQFEERSAEAGLADIPGGLNMLQADYNNDGFTDVLVLRGAWLMDGGRHPNSLLRNNGDGSFTDVTFLAGLAEPSYPTQTAAWSDYDLDGDLDLYIGNEPIGNQPTASQLFQNNGDGTFHDVADAAGVSNLRFAKAVVWGDVDNDRYPDLFVSNLRGENRLYRNRGDGTFEDTTSSAGLSGFLASFPAFFWDYNNDGNLDLYVGAYAASTNLLAQHYLGMANSEGTTDEAWNESMSKLYQGDGNGNFQNVAQRCGLAEPTFAMGVNFGDLDHDGFLDFYLGTGDVDFRHLVPNKMYRNVAGKRFEDVSFSGGFSHLQKGHAVVFADFDQDGDQDVFEQMGGAYQGDKYGDAFFENPGFGNNWLAVDVEGRQSNRSAIGTKLAVYFRDGETSRVVHRQVNSGGSFGANPLRQTIGIGKANSIDRLELFWPKTAKTQVFRDVTPNQIVRVIEGAKSFTQKSRLQHHVSRQREHGTLPSSNRASLEQQRD